MPRSDRKLMRAFDTYNAQYFANELPSDTLVTWARLGETAGDCDGTEIRINSTLKKIRPCWKLTLLHEMAHLATHSEIAEHGPRWNREMRRLYRLGAFDTLL